MIILQVRTNYTFIQKPLLAARLYPSQQPFEITEDTVAELVINYLNQNGSNLTLNYTRKNLVDVVLRAKPDTLLTIGTIQCSRTEAIVMKLCHHIPGQLELKL